MLSITCFLIFRPLISSKPTRPSKSKTSEILMIEVTYELRMRLEYVLFSFFDIAFKNGWGKDRNYLGYT